MNRSVFLLLTSLALSVACTHRIEVPEPVTINLNVKVDHEIRLKVERELDEVFTQESGLF